MYFCTAIFKDVYPKYMKKQFSEEAILAEVFDMIIEWIKDGRNPDLPVINYQKPEELKKKLELFISPEGTDQEGLLNEIRKYLKYAVRTNHPGYLNQLFGGMNFPAFVGEIITSLTNTSMYTYEVAPAATLMENTLMEKMLSYTGWEFGSGSLLTGGSNTNMVAMLLARNTHFETAKMSGISTALKPAVLVSDRSHFSMLKAANTIGIGQNGIIKVRLDPNGRMRGEFARKAYHEAVDNGFHPFMICSTAGTTETGSFDAIDEISEMAEEFGLWHHVDGSWGGSAILSEKRRGLFKGLEHADSFSWNPHKLMNIPLICSALLVKGNNVMREEIQSYDSDYIYHSNPDSEYDLGPGSLQCGRRVDALKLWLAWKFYGDNGFVNRIEHLFDLAGYSTRFVEMNSDLELLFPTQSLNVNFRFKAPDGIDVNELNEMIRYKLIHSGKAMVNYCHLERGLSIRLVLLNPDLEKSDIQRFFNNFIHAGKEILQEQFRAKVV